MAAPRRKSVRVPATARPVRTDTNWREQMSERLAQTAPRLDQAVVRGAACAGVETNVFFPRPNDTAAVEAAKDICRGCPVMRACLMQALRNGDEHAVLGGTTPDERRRIRRRLARERAGASASLEVAA